MSGGVVVAGLAVIFASVLHGGGNASDRSGRREEQ